MSYSHLVEQTRSLKNDFETICTLQNEGGGVDVRVKLLHVRTIGNGEKRVIPNCCHYPSNVASDFQIIPQPEIEKKLNSGVRVRCVIKSTESVKFKVNHNSKNQELVKFKVSHFFQNRELEKFKVSHFSKTQELVMFKVSLVPIILKLELELMNHDTFHFQLHFILNYF